VFILAFHWAWLVQWLLHTAGRDAGVAGSSEGYCLQYLSMWLVLCPSLFNLDMGSRLHREEIGLLTESSVSGVGHMLIIGLGCSILGLGVDH
jgi:hypothetical protein